MKTTSTMKTELRMIAVRDLVKGYEDNGVLGVKGLNGKLNIRPEYQREFVYNPKQRDKVMDTLTKGLPLNAMYWIENDDGELEVLDGQQRTISICQYVTKEYSIDFKNFGSMTHEEQEQILNYELMVFICTGNKREKLDWFETLATAGETPSKQDIRNSLYTGPWLKSAKVDFSKPNCPAGDIGEDYIKGSVVKQHFLETAIKWISEDNIEKYMDEHQFDSDSEELWDYFENVIDWVETTFPKYRKDMKGVNWGEIYNKHKDDDLDPEALEVEVAELMADEEVGKKAGIFIYVLTGEEKHLNVREFSNKDKTILFERQKGVCPCCSNTFKRPQMEADHIVPWSRGGKTDLDNGQMLCRKCNNTKSDK